MILGRATRLMAVLLVALYTTGCHESGTWKNDPRNWKRIFRTQKPDDVVILNSWYWRSSHWTFEYEYYIQIQQNDAIKKQLFDLNKMKRLESSEDVANACRFSQNRPKWFAPKLPAMYEIWIYAEAPQGEFRVFIDNETGDLFLADILL